MVDDNVDMFCCTNMPIDDESIQTMPVSVGNERHTPLHTP